MSYRIVWILICFISFSTFAQDDYKNFLEAGPEDAAVIYREYNEPLIIGFSIGNARGWYQSARPHKPGGIEVTAVVGAVFVPDKDLFYDRAGIQQQWDANGNGTVFTSPEDRYPTMFGPTTPVPEFDVQAENGSTLSIDGPVGFEVFEDNIPEAAPVVIPQLSVGLIKRTDFKFRFLPKTSFDDVTVKMLGFGLQHDIGQWIPGLKIAPVDISFLVGYTNIDVVVENIEDEGDNGEFGMNSFTYQLIASKRISFLTVYGGFGYNHFNADLDVVGEYDVISREDPLVDPISEDFNGSGMNGTLGLRFHISFFSIFADYTFQKYNTASAGIAFSFREADRL
jgi:hypothetical protein